jgi:hypothetical protein
MLEAKVCLVYILILIFKSYPDISYVLVVRCYIVSLYALTHDLRYGIQYFCLYVKLIVIVSKVQFYYIFT